MQMNEDSIFFQKAAEAIMVTSLNSERVDPTIRELLNRVKYVSSPVQPVSQTSQALDGLYSASGQYGLNSHSHAEAFPYIGAHGTVNGHLNGHGAAVIAPENKTILNYFDKLLSNPVSSVSSGQSPNQTQLQAGNMLQPLDPNGASVDGTAVASTQHKRQRQRQAPTELEDKPKKKRRVSKSKKSSATSGVSSGEENSHKAENNSKDSDSEDKRYPCSKCNMVFRRSSDLRRHERQHLPILPNICTLCGKGFARKDALKRHFNTQTCRRNREKLLSLGADINEILERARQAGAKIYTGN